MTKQITLAILALVLGSLACMQSATNTPTATVYPTKPAALSTEPMFEALNSGECTVNAQALNVRDCGGLNCSVIGWLKAGWIVKAEPGSNGSGWLYITRGNLSGFARSDYLTCKNGEISK